jgi:ATP-dependent RNA helicase RhlE
MLDLGFVDPIRKVVKKLPQRRQNLFFSATMPKTIGDLAGEILHNPQEVRVTPQATTVEKIAQTVMHVEASHKRDLLVELLADRKVSRALVFTRTKHGADKLVQYLDKSGLTASAIHGNKSQGQRERALAAFKDGKSPILVATDIAARGIDVDGVSHVFQFELPNVPEAYVHRIGRTARAGAEGVAITLCDVTERGLLRDIEKLTKLAIPAEDRRADQSRPLPDGRPENERAAKQAKRQRGRGKGPEHAHRPDAPTAKAAHRKGQSRPQRSDWSPMDVERPAAAKPARPQGGGFGSRTPAASERPSGGFGSRAKTAERAPGGYGARPAARPQGDPNGYRGPKRERV